MIPQPVSELLRARMRKFVHLGWTVARGKSLELPIFLQLLPMRRWLSLRPMP